MKKMQYIVLVVLGITGYSLRTNAQEGWNQGLPGFYSVGIGGTDVIALGRGAPYYGVSGGSLNFSGEYRVQRLVSIGFETGLDLLHAPYYPLAVENPYPREYMSIGIPIVFKVNVHILEAARVPIQDRLDLYAGLNVGGGPAFYTGPGGGSFGFLVAGPQVGLRYWFNPQMAVFGEFGWGATFGNIGITF